MMRSLYTASTGMYAQQLNVDTIANNISNVNTTSYKKQRAEFQDLLYQQINRPISGTNTNDPVGVAVGLGVKPSAISTSFRQGSLQETDNSTDVAIIGQAFFKVEVPGYDEELYTRDGSFKIDSEGNLCTSDGYIVVGTDSIDENATDIAIAKDGIVTYTTSDGDEAEEAGQIELVKFMNLNGLEKLGGNLYAASASSGDPEDWDPDDDSSVYLQSGYLELSNVQIVDEMVDLISAQRAYEMNSKVITASDEMLQTAANLRR